MAKTVRLIDYFYIQAPDRPGEGVKVLKQLKQARVNLDAFSGFPVGRRAQLDFIPSNPAAFKAVAKKAKWKVVGPKKGFMIQDRDRVGAMADILEKLSAAKINVTASDAICAGGGRFGGLLWVKPRDVKRAAKLLGIA